MARVLVEDTVGVIAAATGWSESFIQACLDSYKKEHEEAKKKESVQTKR